MNFVDPKEYNYPGLVRKNRYKTILPSEYSCNTSSSYKQMKLRNYFYVDYLKLFHVLLLLIMPHCPPADTHSRVILKSQDEDDFLSTYINANYLKVSENAP